MKFQQLNLIEPVCAPKKLEVFFPNGKSAQLGLRGRLVNTMTQKLVVSYSFKGEAADVSRALSYMVKSMWSHSRKDHQATRQFHEQIKTLRERTSYWIMNDPEVYVERFIDEMKNIEKICESMLSSIKTDMYVNELKNLKDKCVSIITMAGISEHEHSIFP